MLNGSSELWSEVGMLNGRSECWRVAVNAGV